jgi:hypothetical protein
MRVSPFPISKPSGTGSPSLVGESECTHTHSAALGGAQYGFLEQSLSEGGGEVGLKRFPLFVHLFAVWLNLRRSTADLSPG